MRLIERFGMDELPKAIGSDSKVTCFYLTVLYHVGINSHESFFGGKTLAA
ncbi:hypothetical protein AVDCRST_MAG84-5597 [uncultured Microcoleus sp.]|uniref:Uncharacterized protein n=1 Tax=uncultured Microcoleus sp. TaxID=259945 RepID=A0A6J4NLP0_9CYAN|nr:hypothetical protein AVDCRST_MAG84-5597 [uncultured Microcoleus sp.]